MNASALAILVVVAALVAGFVAVSWRAIRGRKTSDKADTQTEDGRAQDQIVQPEGSNPVVATEATPQPEAYPKPNPPDLTLKDGPPHDKQVGDSQVIEHTNPLSVSGDAIEANETGKRGPLTPGQRKALEEAEDAKAEDKTQSCESAAAARETSNAAQQPLKIDMAGPIKPGDQTPAPTKSREGRADHPDITPKGLPRSEAEDHSTPSDSLEAHTRKPLDPEKRGGRPRRTNPSATEKEPTNRSVRSPKPELVCWKEQQAWILAVEFPETICRSSGFSVLQNGTPLLEDKSKDGCWRLKTLAGEISAHAEDRGVCPIPTLSLGDSSYHLFKLAGRELRQGRRVKRISRGSYLAVVLACWERDEERAGPAPAMPEPVSLDGYQAHFFDLLSDPLQLIAFRTSSGDPLVVGSPGQTFELVGEELFDANEEQGPIFGGTPPEIQTQDGNWEVVGTIVLGEEGTGRLRWRTMFAPNTARGSQSIPRNVAERRAGWFFVRFYDQQDELVDSLDFRFAAGLHQIKVAETSLFPTKTGHQATTVELHHEGGWHVSPRDARDIEVQPRTDRTILHIPGRAECDRSEWIVRPQEGAGVNVVILVERVWWQVGTERHVPSNWEDKCLPTSREHFTATSVEAIWLRFPRCRWTDRIFAGFRFETRRCYELRVDKSLLAIPLRDFCDSEELRNRPRDQFLRIWLEVNGTIHESAVLMVAAEPAPRCPDIRHVSPPEVASVLTCLCKSTRGPLRKVFMEVRHLYRRPRWSRKGANDEFVKHGLCAIAIYHQLVEGENVFVPRRARRWKARAEAAGKQFPEIMRKLWRIYSRSARRRQIG